MLRLLCVVFAAALVQTAAPKWDLAQGDDGGVTIRISTMALNGVTIGDVIVTLVVESPGQAPRRVMLDFTDNEVRRLLARKVYERKFLLALKARSAKVKGE